MLETRLIDGKEVTFVKPLNEELEGVPPELVINMDEKPLLADSPKSRTIGIARAYGRTKSWTVTPVINARGDLILATLIIRGESVSKEVAQDVVDSKLNIGISATENASVTDNAFFNTLFDEEEGVVAELKEHYGLSVANPAILILDGHSSRLTRKVVAALIKASIFAIVIPSHTSTIHQPCDNGVQKKIQDLYEGLYSNCIRFGGLKPLTVRKRVRLVLQTINFLSVSKNIIQACWAKVGMKDGHLHPEDMHSEDYRLGLPHRDVELPHVTPSILKEMFSPSQLIRDPLDSVRVSCKLMKIQQMKAKLRDLVAEGMGADQKASGKAANDGTFLEYVLSRTRNAETTALKYMWYCETRPEQIQRYMAYRMHTDDEEEIDGSILGRVMKGASGRISTADGRMLYRESCMREIITIDTALTKKRNVKEMNAEKLRIQLLDETPVHVALLRLGYCKLREKPVTVTEISTFNRAHTNEKWNVPFKGLRSQKIEAVAAFIIQMNAEQKELRSYDVTMSEKRTNAQQNTCKTSKKEEKKPTKKSEQQEEKRDLQQEQMKSQQEKKISDQNLKVDVDPQLNEKPEEQKKNTQQDKTGLCCICRDESITNERMKRCSNCKQSLHLRCVRIWIRGGLEHEPVSGLLRFKEIFCNVCYYEEIWMRSPRLTFQSYSELTRRCFMNTDIVDAGQTLLKVQFPHMLGLTSVLCGHRPPDQIRPAFDPQPQECIQLHYNGAKHYVVSTSFGR